MEASEQKIDTIVSVDFFDFPGDFLCEVSRNAFGHGAAHVGLCLSDDRYIYPRPSTGLMIRRPEVIYRAVKPDLFIQLYAKEPLNPNWFDKHKGKRLSNVFWRFITEPVYLVADIGVEVNLPKRETCVSQIVDILNGLDIICKAGTPQGLYRELVNHPMRVG